MRLVDELPARRYLLASDFEEVVCCSRLEPFVSVAGGYERYPDVTDTQVRALLARAWARSAPREMAPGNARV